MDHTSQERERLEGLFRAHHASVRAYVRRRVTGGDVDDIVSDVFLVAWRRLDDVPDDPLPWLLGVARNAVGTARRGEARRLRLHARAQADHAEAIEGPEETLGDERIRAALARLTDSDRETLTLIAWEGLTPSQAAAVLGIPPNRFRVRLHRAGRRLRWALQAESDATTAPERRGTVPRRPSQGAIT